MSGEQTRARWLAAQGLDGRAATAGVGMAASAKTDAETETEAHADADAGGHTARADGAGAAITPATPAAAVTPAAVAVADAARRAAGIQAQASAPARLAVRARTAGLTAADVDAACESRAVVRTWLMRGTIHMVPAADLRGLLAVFGPVNVRNGRRRREQLGLDDALCERALEALAAILPGRALTRAEIVSELAGHGVVLDLGTQAPPHLLAYASGRALICRGPDAERDEPTYVLLDEWLGPGGTPDRDRALADVARMYFAAYAPADAADFKAWSGLPATDVRRALEQVPPPEEPPGVSPVLRTRTLLGAFDPYLLGHATRAAVLDPAHARRLNAGGGMIAPAMLRDGVVVGTWKLDRSRKRPRFVFDPFEPFEPFESEGDVEDVEGVEPGEDVETFRAEADDVLRFLGVCT